MKNYLFSAWITNNDKARSATVHCLDDLFRSLLSLKGINIKRMLDIGCGYGGLPKTIAEFLGIDEIHGVDIDAEALKEAETKGIITHQLDVDKGNLPFNYNYFDLVVSFGMMDYLPFFDHIINDIYRVLHPGGYILISLPNLASWHNRLMLFLGYQLRDVEVSEEILSGVAPWYKGQKPTGHIHSVTPRALSELMTYHGFETIKINPGRPRTKPLPKLYSLVDILFSQKATLARRFFYLGRKSHNEGKFTRQQYNNPGKKF